MILADTSVWIGHLRQRDPVLAALLDEGEVCQHPFIIGELACGNLRNREKLLESLATLPLAAPATDQEVMTLLTRHQLFGAGLGWVDLHLLASALLTQCQLFTHDRRLFDTAAKLKAAYLPAF